MTELQAEILLKQAARIEVLEERVEALKAALREIATMDPENIRADDLGRAARIAAAALAPEQDR